MENNINIDNATENIEPVKRGRGRPKGSINKNAAYVRVPLSKLNELLGAAAMVPVKRDFIEALLGNGEDEEMQVLSVQQPSVAKVADAPMTFSRVKTGDLDAGDEPDEDTGDIPLDWTVVEDSE